MSLDGNLFGFILHEVHWATEVLVNIFFIFSLNLGSIQPLFHKIFFLLLFSPFLSWCYFHYVYVVQCLKVSYISNYCDHFTLLFFCSSDFMISIKLSNIDVYFGLVWRFNIWLTPESIPCSLVKNVHLAVVRWICDSSLCHLKSTMELLS